MKQGKLFNSVVDLLIEICTYVVPVIDITLVLLFLSISLNSFSRVCFT